MDVRQENSATDVVAGPGTHPGAESLTLLLRRTEHLLSRRVADGIAPILADLDLTPERWRLLASLAVTPGQTMTDLSRSAVLPPASVTRHMDRLVSHGLVLRKAHAGDRRRVVAALTERGTQAYARVREREQQVSDELRAGFGPQRYDILVSELRLLPMLIQEI